MKIFINGRFLTQPITGVQRYAIELLKSLDTMLETGTINPHNVQFELVAPNVSFNHLDLKCISLVKIGALKGHMWEQIELPLYARGKLLINLCNLGPLLKHNQIVTIHDAAVYAVPNSYSFAFGRWYRFLLKRIAVRSRKVITDSVFSKKELMKYTNVNQNAISVSYLGKEHILRIEKNDDIIVRNKLSKDKFILAVSSINPNKNFISIAKAVELLNRNEIDIVIAGARNDRVFGAGDDDLPGHIRHVGYVSDNELKSLYENALGFIFPSFYEGFGLPPLEAMVCGCPVIVSNTASLPEVCGDAAIYCDPYDPQDIANKINELIDNAELRQALRDKGLERSKLFTWEKCAKETMEVIEEVLPQ